MRSPKSDWMPSSTPSFVPLDATSVHSVRYTGEGPVVQEKPLQHRGSEQLGPRGWIRGETAAVEYSYLPLSPPPAPLPQSRKTLTKRRQADVRVRRALRDAWCDPSRARKDLLDAGAKFAEIEDGQGLAMAFIAHAQTRLGDSNLAGFAPHLCLSAVNLAREEYSHAHAICTSLLYTRPTTYDGSRHYPFEKAATKQRMRPTPLVMGAEDAKAAAGGA